MDERLDIHLYMTTHDEELPKLNSLEHIEEVKRWFSQVDNVAVHHNHFSRVDDKLIAEASKHEIVNCHSIVFYPPGKLVEAHNVGRELKEFFHNHRKTFDWHMAPNPKLMELFEVYLEIVVKRKEEGAPEEGGESKPAVGVSRPVRRESLEERNRRILEAAHSGEHPKSELYRELQRRREEGQQ
jgi:hypothetical protein